MRNVLSPTWLTFLISWLSDVLLLHKSYTCAITPTNFNENFVIHSLKFGYCFLKLSGMVFIYYILLRPCHWIDIILPRCLKWLQFARNIFLLTKRISDWVGHLFIFYFLHVSYLNIKIIDVQDISYVSFVFVNDIMNQMTDESILPSWLLDRGTVASLFKWILQFDSS